LIDKINTYLRRTSGNKSGNRLFKIYRKELAFINKKESLDDIKKNLIRADYKGNFKKIKIFQSKSHERHAEKRAMNHLDSYFKKISWDILIKVMVS